MNTEIEATPATSAQVEIVDCVPYASPSGKPAKVTVKGCAGRYRVANSPDAPFQTKQSKCRGCDIGRDRLEALKGGRTEEEATGVAIVYFPDRAGGGGKFVPVMKKARAKRAEGMARGKRLRAEAASAPATVIPDAEKSRDEARVGLINLGYRAREVDAMLGGVPLEVLDVAELIRLALRGRATGTPAVQTSAAPTLKGNEMAKQVLKDIKCANPECGKTFTPKRKDSTACGVKCSNRANYLKAHPDAGSRKPVVKKSSPPVGSAQQKKLRARGAADAGGEAPLMPSRRKTRRCSRISPSCRRALLVAEKPIGEKGIVMISLKIREFTFGQKRPISTITVTDEKKQAVAHSAALLRQWAAHLERGELHREREAHRFTNPHGFECGVCADLTARIAKLDVEIDAQARLANER